MSKVENVFFCFFDSEMKVAK